MKQLTGDIVIVSAGTAGISAAATAAEGGAGVLSFEKAGRAGGTTGSGIFAVESRVQRLQQYQLTKEEAFKRYMDFTHWRVNARLVKTLIDESSFTIDWLEGLGVEFEKLYSHGVGNAYTQHTVKFEQVPGKMVAPAAIMMKILLERAQAKGARVFLKTPVKQILKKGNKVTGVIAQDATGEEIHAEARAVIVATGGYSVGTMPGSIGGIGDGIRLAKEAGADVKESEITEKKMPGMRMGFGMRLEVIENTSQQPVLYINTLGERFMNEEILLGMAFGSNAIYRQPGKTAFSLFDMDTLEYYVKNNFDFFPMGNPISREALNNYSAEIKQLRENGTENKNMFMADSLEELSAKTGIDLNGLRQTVNEYNKACETGRDTAFGKKARYLMPVARPPFFANKRESTSIVSWNGIKVNHKTEVLTPEFRPIPGLYAAGIDIASELYYDTYPMILPATAMGFAVNSGRIAAKNALEYIKTV